MIYMLYNMKFTENHNHIFLFFVCMTYAWSPQARQTPETKWYGTAKKYMVSEADNGNQDDGKHAA